MITTSKFSPSINIIRDQGYRFHYVVTPNIEAILSQLCNDIVTGIKCHSIIGSFGTGKSTFLLALQQSLTGEYNHFKKFSKIMGQLPSYEFVSIVGDYTSLIDVFAQYFNCVKKGYSAKDVLQAVDKTYKQLQKKGKGLAILIDEFGKFLEYASKNNPETQLYFIQQLAELMNDAQNNTLLITTLHQDFNAYSVDLNRMQQLEWDKVRGRLRDIVFNEPVEQLLFLASEKMKLTEPTHNDYKSLNKLFACIKDAKVFPLRDYLDIDFAKKMLPLDILAAAVLTLALQKYGQNERSLFLFIESRDYLNIDYLAKECNYYSIPQVFDYLINKNHALLTTKYNPHFTQWSAIKRSLEKIEGVLNIGMFDDAIAIIKTIGLLNIFSSAAGRLDTTFYLTYSKLALGIKNPETILKELEKFKIVKYTAHNFRYTLLQGTDLDIDLAIDDAGRLVEKVTNVAHHLSQYFDFPFISAKSIFYQIGTPRFFQFKLSDEPINQRPEGEVDGYINLVFADDSEASKRVEDASRNCDEAILYGYYKNTDKIKNLLFEIHKVRNVIVANQNDKIAIKELNEVETHYVKLLNYHVLDSLYADDGKVIWYYRGLKQRILGRQGFNQLLSLICREVYSLTPVFKNELINKTNLSGQIVIAKKNLLVRLLNNLNEIELGFDTNRFPPEKTIYLSLLQYSGIHRCEDGDWVLSYPTDNTFAALWQTGLDFLESSKGKGRSILDFIELLSSKPFKLKRGLIDYWLPIFLIAKNDEFALYNDKGFIPELSWDLFEIMSKKPELFKIKAFDIQNIKLQLFNRYRLLLNQSEQKKPNNKIFIQTIKPFLTFYRDLPEYSKKTQRLTKRTILLRQIIATAKDPEKVFFEDFPVALGYSMQELQLAPSLAESFIKRLQDTIRELRLCYDGLVNRFEHILINEILGTKKGFPEYIDDLKSRFKKLKTHMLLPRQKAFYNRIEFAIDDRTAWLNSISHACIGKPLASISDEDEVFLYEKLKEMIYELDNLCELSLVDINHQNEDVLKLEITSFVKGLNKALFRMPKAKTKEFEAKATEVKQILGADKKTNINLLTKLLFEIINSDEES